MMMSSKVPSPAWIKRVTDRVREMLFLYDQKVTEMERLLIRGCGRMMILAAEGDDFELLLFPNKSGQLRLYRCRLVWTFGHIDNAQALSGFARGGQEIIRAENGSILSPISHHGIHFFLEKMPQHPGTFYVAMFEDLQDLEVAELLLD